MAITFGDAFQNWNPDTNLPSTGATVDGGVVGMLEANLFRDKVMQPGITYSTDVESLMVDNRFAVAFIRKLDKIKVTTCKASSNGAFRVVPTQTDGNFLEIKCNDVLKVGEVINEPYDAARVSGRTADRVALAGESYDEIKELQYLSYLINGGGSPDPTDVGAPASANTTQSTKDTIMHNIIEDRKTLRKAGADPDTLLLSEDGDAMFLERINDRNYFVQAGSSEVAALGKTYLGSLFAGKVKIFTTNALGQENYTLFGLSKQTIKASDSDDVKAEKTANNAKCALWDWSNIEYILYDHRTLAIVNVVRYAGIIDYGAIEHNSSLISFLTVCGGRVRNTQKAIAKKYTA